MPRWTSCIVFDPAPPVRHLWQFSTSGKFTLQKEEARLPEEPLPEKLYAKDWQSVFQPKLNIAWLPPESVFLRAVQLPAADPAELHSMLELQLEKLSPLPTAQIVWSYRIIPSGEDQMRTAVLVIVPRSHIETFLGTLEGQKYLADRLELPLVDELLPGQAHEQGVWVHPAAGGDPACCMIAWWFGGTLQNLALLRLPHGERHIPAFQEHLRQTTWAGEMEGWLTGPMRFHLVADPETAEAWKGAFPENAPVELHAPTAGSELAGLTVRRAIKEPARVNLLPVEFATRYRQKLIDRLWMRALFAIIFLYTAGVAIYLGWAQVAKFQYDQVEDELVSIGQSYTNTIKLKEEVRILKDQVELQYAALECYRAVAENLPTELTLTSLSFERGRRLTVSGTCPSSSYEQVLTFNDKLRQATVKGEPLFSMVNPPNRNPRAGGLIAWIFAADLKRTEIE